MHPVRRDEKQGNHREGGDDGDREQKFDLCARREIHRKRRRQNQNGGRCGRLENERHENACEKDEERHQALHKTLATGLILAYPRCHVNEEGYLDELARLDAEAADIEPALGTKGLEAERRKHQKQKSDARQEKR